MKPLSIIGYLAMVAGLVGLLVTKTLFVSSPVVIVLQILGCLLLVWARFSFGRRSFHVAANPTAGGLVTVGPYRVIRHPIYTAICAFTLPPVLAHWSWSAGLLGALILAGALARMLIEERLLLVRYPEYAAYAAKTWRMLPCVF